MTDRKIAALILFSAGLICFAAGDSASLQSDSQDRKAEPSQEQSSDPITETAPDKSPTANAPNPILELNSPPKRPSGERYAGVFATQERLQQTDDPEGLEEFRAEVITAVGDYRNRYALREAHESMQVQLLYEASIGELADWLRRHSTTDEQTNLAVAVLALQGQRFAFLAEPEKTASKIIKEASGQIQQENYADAYKITRDALVACLGRCPEIEVLCGVSCVAQMTNETWLAEGQYLLSNAIPAMQKTSSPRLIPHLNHLVSCAALFEGGGR